MDSNLLAMMVLALAHAIQQGAHTQQSLLIDHSWSHTSTLAQDSVIVLYDRSWIATHYRSSIFSGTG